MNLAAGTPVHVRWVDSCRYDHGWKPLSWWREHLKASAMENVSEGIFLFGDDDFVAVALSLEANDRDDPNACQVMQIPRGSILALEPVHVEA